MSEEAHFELWDRPAYERGDRVVALRDVRNDGTHPGARIGEFLIREGEVGYVSRIGTYLNRFYVYAVDFVGCERLVGMRAHELAPAAEPERRVS
jgi:nitrogen fixation protein NifZ